MGEKAGNASQDARSQLIVPVGFVVTLVWAFSALAGLYTGNFVGLEVVSPVMMIFAGYLFGINIVRTGEKNLNLKRRAPNPPRSKE